MAHQGNCMKDYYAVLEVDHGATPDEIRAQYRLMIQAWHPDKFGSPQQKARAEAKAMEIIEAYDVLSHPVKRAEYDSLLCAQPQPQPQPQTQGPEQEVNSHAAPPRPPQPQQQASSQPSQPSAGAERLILPGGVTLELVRVPAGEFLMGSADGDPYTWSHCKPQHRVFLHEYLIGRYPVTNAQYAACAAARRLRWPTPAGKENHPVVNVNWGEAVAFCQWASRVAGREVRLPTEAQWEKAARGADGRVYPWGNERPDAARLNFDSRPRLQGGVMSGLGTTPVGRYSPYGDSVYGAADMLGNVDEWTASTFRPYPHEDADAPTDPPTEATKARIVRGGNFYSRVGFLGCARRDSQAVDCRWDYLGFRVAVSAT